MIARAKQAGARSIISGSNKVRFCAHNGLTPDIAPCPLSLNKNTLSATSANDAALMNARKKGQQF
jgi:hypothetical protein